MSPHPHLVGGISNFCYLHFLVAMAAMALTTCIFPSFLVVDGQKILITGPPQVIFNNSHYNCTSDGKGPDNPDVPARAFVDNDAVVHLIASCHTSRFGTGPSLLETKHNCTVAFNSQYDPSPRMFQDNEWIHATYIMNDSNVVFGLIHDEYHGYQHDNCGMSPWKKGFCWMVTLTAAVSHDGGYSWQHLHPAPAHLVAAVPYPYVNASPWFGWGDTGGIIRSPKDGFFYTTAHNRHDNGLQRNGTCLMRTPDLFNLSAWRGWDGLDFTVPFADPYSVKPGQQGKHICQPLELNTWRTTNQGLVWSVTIGKFLGVFRDYGNTGEPPFYIAISDDLIHWSNFQPLYNPEPAGDMYNYPTIMDPDAPSRGDRNFETIDDSAYIFYTHMPSAGNGWRALTAVPFTIKW